MIAVEQQEHVAQKKKIWIILLMILLLISGVVSYYTFFKKSPETATVTVGDFLPDGKDASKMSDKQLADYAQKAVDKSQFNVRIVSNATIDQQSGKGNIGIQNPPNNTYPVDVIITDNATGEKLYSSGAIYPGEEIKEATLEKSLAKGSYVTTATFNIYNEQTKKQQGTVQSELTLVVK